MWQPSFHLPVLLVAVFQIVSAARYAFNECVPTFGILAHITQTYAYTHKYMSVWRYGCMGELISDFKKNVYAFGQRVIKFLKIIVEKNETEQKQNNKKK